MRAAVDNAHGSVRRIIELADQSGCKPISLMAPRFGLVDLINGNVGSFLRAGSVVRKDRRTIPANWPAVSDGYNLIEPAATSYYWQSRAEVNGINATTEAPPTRTVSLPVGSYVLWCEGNSGLSVAIAAGTAVGSGFGSISAGGSIALAITTAGTVVVTPSNGVVGDIVQLHSGSWRHSFIPTPTSSPVTAASAAADTSGNGLSIPLSRGMIDSLVGEYCPNYDFSGTYTSGLAHDWVIPAASGTTISVSQETTDTDGAAAVQRVTVGANAENKNNQITATLATNIVTGYAYEVIVRAKRLSGCATPKVSITRGAATQWSNSEEYALNTWETHTYRFTANTSGVATVFFGLAWNQAGEFLVKRVSIRRILDSGQTNPGEGTVICGVYLPWGSSVVPNNTVLGVLGVNNAAFGIQTIYRSSIGAMSAARGSDGVSPTFVSTEFAAGLYILISQWSAVTGQMRVGIYNPTTGVLTWSSYVAYRGFFPIHSSNLLRFFYGGGNFPIYVGGLRWLNSIGSDAECVRLSKEMLP